MKIRNALNVAGENTLDRILAKYFSEIDITIIEKMRLTMESKIKYGIRYPQGYARIEHPKEYTYYKDILPNLEKYEEISNILRKFEDEMIDKFEPLITRTLPKDIGYLLSEENWSATNYLKRHLFSFYLIAYVSTTRKNDASFAETLDDLKYLIQPWKFLKDKKSTKYDDMLGRLYVPEEYLKQLGLREGAIRNKKRYDKIRTAIDGYRKSIEKMTLMSADEWIDMNLGRKKDGSYIIYD